MEHCAATSVQAALLLDVQLQPLLNLLMGAEYSASELATQLDLSLQRVHYLLRKLQRAGVAEVVDVWPRAGRPIKRYRVSPRWLVPFEVTGAETVELFVEAQILPRMQTFVRLVVRQIVASFSEWGFWLESEEGAANLHMGDPDGAARDLFEGDEPFLLNFRTAHLTREQASELKRRLRDVLVDFDGPPGTTGQPYTLALLLTQGVVG